jgi:hypothetical protein
MYHGPTKDAEPYFGTLGYKLPKGESVADWLIDISSGRLETSSAVKKKRQSKQKGRKRSTLVDDNCVGTKGVTTGKIDRYVCCECWKRVVVVIDRKIL